MPELPEVETVRAGLQRWVAGRRIAAVEDVHARAVRRHPGGASDLAAQLAGRSIESVQRRGKYLWLPLGAPDALAAARPALIAHLGMSGQLLVLPADTPPGPHLRARIRFADGGPELRFVDQRTFGGLRLDDLTDDGPTPVPVSIAHIARDPLDPLFDDARWIAAVRRRHTTIKRALLDQSSISGVGNIYADEALWRARLHGDRPTAGLTRAQLVELLAAIREVFAAALLAGGTSFDALYVNVNGQSGYFDRSLNAYGQLDRPCARCGTSIRRLKWMNRSSYYCPSCQRPPRAPRAS
ncbi:MAG: fpg1 [Frankiales bacterium]|nr:fpg1 [Frankiales bacterium]